MVQWIEYKIRIQDFWVSSPSNSDQLEDPQQNTICLCLSFITYKMKIVITIYLFQVLWDMQGGALYWGYV